MSKAKRLLPKTPKKKKSPPSAYKTPQKTAEKSSEELATELSFSDQVGESPWKSPGELALKKLAPAPGWKPFGIPTKRKLHGKDW